MRPQYLRGLLPPSLEKLLLRLGVAGNRYKYGYSTWAGAEALCSGYNDSIILSTVIESSRKVKNGEAAFDRDGVVFQKPDYSWPLLTALLGTPRSKNSFRVVDWGGALGSTYRQNVGLLNDSKLDVNWVVVEQPHLAAIGASQFSDSRLSFTDSLDELKPNEFDVVLFAGSVCYLEKPAQVIRKAVQLSPTRIVFDRTPEVASNHDVIGIQRVGRKIYKASYPIWAFAPGSLAKMIGPDYKLSFDWISKFQPDPQTTSKGYCFDRIN